MSLHRLHGLTFVNRNGGFYHPGVLYNHQKVGHALYHDNYPVMPSINAVAKKAKVSRMYASLVIEELHLTGTLIDPKIIKEQRIEE
jgi:hypothetical protein